jgi:predicted NBD/HSP70 family sugar kinase
VLIGGGFGSAAFDLLVPAARGGVLQEALSPAGQELEIERAALQEAGVIGAGLIALEAV